MPLNPPAGGVTAQACITAMHDALTGRTAPAPPDEVLDVVDELLQPLDEQQLRDVAAWASFVAASWLKRWKAADPSLDIDDELLEIGLRLVTRPPDAGEGV